MTNNLTSIDLAKISDVKIINQKLAIETLILKQVSADLISKYEKTQSLHTLAFLRDILKKPAHQLHDTRDTQLVMKLINNIMLSIQENNFKL